MQSRTSIRGGRYCCHYCLQAFSTKEILKGDTKDCFKINAKRRIVKPKEDVFVKFKNNENN